MHMTHSSLASRLHIPSTAYIRGVGGIKLIVGPTGPGDSPGDVMGVSGEFDLSKSELGDSDLGDSDLGLSNVFFEVVSMWVS
jgi:hypothetical protein